MNSWWEALAHDRPAIIKGMGYSNVNAQLLTVPVYLFAAIVYLIFARLSEKYACRGPFLFGGLVIVLIGELGVSSGEHLAHTQVTLCWRPFPMFTLDTPDSSSWRRVSTTEVAQAHTPRAIFQPRLEHLLGRWKHCWALQAQRDVRDQPAAGQLRRCRVSRLGGDEGCLLTLPGSGPSFSAA